MVSLKTAIFFRKYKEYVYSKGKTVPVTGREGP
jgi:hypothetical protein